MWLRDAVGLATAAVAAHLLLVTVLPIANPSLLRDSRSRAPATKLSADERLERLERLLVTLDLRLEAMDERIKNIQLSADREADVMASPQPARPRTMRESRASKHAESASTSTTTASPIVRASYPLMDELTQESPPQQQPLSPQRHGSSRAASSSSASTTTDTPAWLSSMLQEMREPIGGEGMGRTGAASHQQALTPQRMSQPSVNLQQIQMEQQQQQPQQQPQLQQPVQPVQPKARQKITLSDVGETAATRIDRAATVAATSSGSATAYATASRAKIPANSKVSAVPARATSSAGPTSAAASLDASATSSKPAKRRKPPKKDDDWEEDWAKEDEEEKARPSSSSPSSASRASTSSLLDELQKLLAKQHETLNAKAGKKLKKEKKGKRNQKARVESPKDDYQAGDGARASTGGSDDGEMTIEDVD